jgi:hypothetical protein
MKKTTNKTSQHRKLVLRREGITVLTPPQLTKVPGAEGTCTYYSGCPPWETTP